MGLFNRKKKEEKQEAEEIPTELPIFMRRAIARPLEAFVDKYPGNYIVVPTPEEFREGTTLAPEIETYTSVVLNIPEVPKHSLIYKLTPPKADEPYKVYTIGRHPAHNDIWVPSNNVSRATHAQIIIRRKNGGLELKLKDANPICSDLKTFVWDEIGARLHQLDYIKYLYQIINPASEVK